MKFIQALLVAVIGSVLANIAVLYVLRSMVMDASQHLMALTPMPVIMFTLIGAVGATIVYALMRAFLARPNKPFVILSVIVLLVSLIPDYLIVGQTSGAFAGGTLPEALLLMLMHAVAALVIVLSLTKLWGPKVRTAPVV